MTSLPTRVDPTKQIPLISGCSSMPVTTSLPPLTTFHTPGGMPASSANSAIFVWLIGSSLEGFTTMQFPQATANGANHSGTINGKLNGPIMPNTPRGCRYANSSIPTAISSRRAPCINEGIPVATSTISIPRLVSPRDSSIVFPCSIVWTLLTSSKCSSISSFNLKRYLTLATGVVFLHMGKVSLATFTASSISSRVETGTLANTFCVAGFITFKIFSDLDLTHSPPM